MQQWREVGGLNPCGGMYLQLNFLKFRTIYQSRSLTVKENIVEPAAEDGTQTLETCEDPNPHWQRRAVPGEPIILLMVLMKLT